MVSKNNIGNELILEQNNFHRLEMRTNLHALAQLIQNICFIEKGTYPNQPNLGVGIENYVFEKADEGTLATLEEEISSQIEKFIPNNYIITTNVEKKNIKNFFSLLLTFTIKDTENDIETTFGMIFGRNQKSQKVVSKLLV